MDKKKLLGELQLGNYINHKTPDGEWKAEERGIIQWTADCWYDVGESILDTEDLFPIELNDDWIEDFGCKIEYNSRVEFPDDSLWQFTLYKSTYELTTNYTLEVNLSSTYVYIEYVHQFQNLYTLISSGKKLQLKTK